MYEVCIPTKVQPEKEALMKRSTERNPGLLARNLKLKNLALLRATMTLKPQCRLSSHPSIFLKKSTISFDLHVAQGYALIMLSVGDMNCMGISQNNLKTLQHSRNRDGVH